MDKPDGIPQDIWDLAGDCVRRLRLPELLDIEFDTPEEMNRLTMEIVGEDGLTIARAIMAERASNKAILQQLYDLLHNDTSNGGAASFLPGDGDGAEEYVDRALDILRANGVTRYGAHAEA